jgi:undecaprenyl-diphosphatase
VNLTGHYFPGVDRDGAIEWRRHPADLARLVAASLALTAVLLLTAIEPDALTTASDDLVDAVHHLPASARSFVAGVLQVAALVLPVVGLIWACLRRSWRPLLVTLGALVVAVVAMALLTDWLDRVAPARTAAAEDAGSWITGQAFPSASYLAALSAVVIALSPLLHRRWRRALWIGVGVVAVLRMTTAAAVPVNVLVAILLGVVAGSAVLAAFGAPARRLDPASLIDALARSGLRVDTLEALPSDGRPVFVGRRPDGPAVRVTFVGRDERDADLLYRAWRMLRVKGIDDQLADVRPGAQVRHEALASYLAAGAGASVAGVVAVGETPDDDGLLALVLVEGRPLADLTEDDVTDALLHAVWVEVGRLHAGRIAHRRLSTDQVLVGPDGAPTIIGLRWSQMAATDLRLAADVAELLVATAAVVGPERAVAAAAETVATERLTEALPLIQPLALSPSTRRLVKEEKELVTAVREQVQTTTGADAVELFPLERIGWGQVASAFGVVFLALVAIAFISNWSDISEALSEADWSRLPLTVVLAGLTYVAGALSLMGSVLRPLPLGRTTIVMFGQSFLNRFTPMNAGGMAMRVRYLQKGGTDVAVAATAVGITSAASGVMQVVLVLLFVLAAGSSPGGAIQLPDISLVAVVVVFAALFIGLVTVIPSARRFAARWLKIGWARLGGEFKGLAGRPDKLALLFGGAGLAKLLTITCFVASCRAVGITVAFADLGMLYLIGSTVGSAVPTPGGVGGVEAALIAVLTGAGVDSATAAAAVVIFRLVTYWLPVVPGYFCLRYSRKAELV